jgi:two-component system, chemotaxis family, chemotaxis protein CheY
MSPEPALSPGPVSASHECELTDTRELDVLAVAEDRVSWQPPTWLRHPSGSSDALDSPNSVAVLVVDDNEAVRSSFSDILRSAGYTVIEAADGEDALSLLTTMRFDAMVLDLKMPRRDGASLLAALSEPPAVVVVSACELDDKTRNVAGSTIVTHLRKPVPPQQLLDAVADATGMDPS